MVERVMTVVLSDFEVAFLGEEEDEAFRSFLCYFFVYTPCCIIENVCRENTLFTLLEEVFCQGQQLFCF